MDKQKEIQFSLRKYFVRLFFIILVATSFIGVAVIFFEKSVKNRNKFNDLVTDFFRNDYCDWKFSDVVGIRLFNTSNF